LAVNKINVETSRGFPAFSIGVVCFLDKNIVQKNNKGTRASHVEIRS